MYTATKLLITTAAPQPLLPAFANHACCQQFKQKQIHAGKADYNAQLLACVPTKATADGHHTLTYNFTTTSPQLQRNRCVRDSGSIVLNDQLHLRLHALPLDCCLHLLHNVLREAA